MGPLPRRAVAAAAAVAALVAGGGWLFLASRDAPPSARLRPGAGAGGDGRPDGRWVVAQDADELAPAWSPDGTRLTFVRDGNLFIIRPDGSGAACVRVGMLLTSGARWRP